MKGYLLGICLFFVDMDEDSMSLVANNDIIKTDGRKDRFCNYLGRW